MDKKNSKRESYIGPDGNVRPNFIPRERKGAGGLKFFNIPGVKYPDSVLHTQRGCCRETNKPYTKIPGWGISTNDAATLLHCSRSAARAFLHRRKVGFRLVSEGGGPPRLYWRRSQVEAIAAKKRPLVKQIPARMVDSVTAREMLGVGRSTIYRYVHKKILNEQQVLLITPRGTRVKACYLRSEVAKLAAKIRAIRKKEEELGLLLRRRTEPDEPDAS